jgi:myo-inositol 2-dehydrogenase/D-chiro-inositol 1-dehydrogenase
MRVGVVGAGRIGGVHAGNCRRDPAVSALTVIDPAGLPPALAGSGVTWQDRLTPGVVAGWDAAIVCVPTAEHYRTVRQLLAADLPVFCEKPLTLDVGSSLRLGELAESRGLPLRIGLQRRFDQALREVRAVVVAGRLGHLLHGYTATCDPAPPPREYLRGSGGIFVDMHIHDFDVLGWLLGDEIETVHAVAGGGVPAALDGLDDFGVTQVGVSTRGGLVGSVWGSRWSAAGYQVLAGVRGTDGEVRMDATGRVTLRDRAGETILHAGGGGVPGGFTERFAEAYRAEIQAFLAELRGQGGGCAHWHEEVRALRAARAAERSARTGGRCHAGYPCAATPNAIHQPSASSRSRIGR